jgi:hypothetical protein
VGSVRTRTTLPSGGFKTAASVSRVGVVQSGSCAVVCGTRPRRPSHSLSYHPVCLRLVDLSCTSGGRSAETANRAATGPHLSAALRSSGSAAHHDPRHACRPRRPGLPRTLTAPRRAAAACAAVMFESRLGQHGIVLSRFHRGDDVLAVKGNPGTPRITTRPARMSSHYSWPPRWLEVRCEPRDNAVPLCVERRRDGFAMESGGPAADGEERDRVADGRLDVARNRGHRRQHG